MISLARVLATIKLLVDDTEADGPPVFEELLTERIEKSQYRLLKSPGLMAGLAAGDEIEVQGSASEISGYKVLKRGMNVCVQFWAPAELMERCSGTITDRVERLGGRLDGEDETLRVYTIPVCIGFPAIESVFLGAEKEWPGIEWLYGNVPMTSRRR